MAKIPLRVYLREIEDAIDEGHIDEAVTHCRHILKIFPKQIDVYRKLGKAYLEAQKYGNSADIFERVLSAVPDDFVSHVGMSIVREDEGNFETAIWHMERAFETQPYNPAIQGEIKRLHGIRDGMEPAKARLTQGALARMYAKGGHFKQAIAELRNTLAQDPNRPDLLVPLAEMYANNGQNVEAIQTCSTVLRELPYCLKANRLLAQLLEGTEREDERKKCLQRLYALDPYEAHVSENALEAKDVPDQAVTIDRLYWDGNANDVDSEKMPEWESSAASIGQSSDSEEGVPDWLSTASEDDPASDEAVFPESEDDGEIPPWMQDAGWGPSAGEFDEQEASLSFEADDVEEDDEFAISADLPEWIRDMAPEAGAAMAAESNVENGELEKLDSIFSDSQSDDQPDPPSDDTLDWLQDSDIESPDSDSKSEDPSLPDFLQNDESSPSAETGESDALDWLSDQEDAPSEETESPIAEAESDLPDWLSEGSVEPEPETQGKEEEIPDWLKGVDEKDSATGPDGEPAQAESQPGGVTDFLLGLQSASQESEASEESEIPDWLQDSEAVPTESSPEISTPQDESGEISDWEKETEQEIAPTLQSEAKKEEAESLDWLSDPDAAAEPETEQSGGTTDDDIPDWLQSPDDEPVAPSPEPEVQPAKSPQSQMDELPDWLDGEDAEEGIAAQADDDIPDFLKVDDEPVAESTDDDVPDWLKVSDAADELVDSSETPTDEPPTEEPQPDVESLEDMPDWLKGLEEASAETLEKVEAQADSEVPNWLDKLAGDDILEEKTPAESAQTIATQTDLEASHPEDGELSPQKRRETASLALEADDEDEIHYPSHEGILMDQESENEADVPEWLAESEADSQESLVEGIQDDPDFPEWLAEPAQSTAPAESDIEKSDIEEADSAMAWLDGLDTKQDVSEEELQPNPEDRLKTPFDQAQAETQQMEKPVEEKTPPSDDIPDWLKDDPVKPEADLVEESGQPEAESSPLDDIDWLQDLEKDQEVIADTGISDEEPILEETGHTDDGAEWLKDESDVPLSEKPMRAQEVTSEQAASDADESPEFEDADAAMAWLEGLAAKQGVSEEELLSSPTERPDAPPEWVQDSMEEAEESPELTVETEVKKDIEATVETEAAPSPEDIPEWLQEGAFAPPADQTTDTIETPPLDDITIPTTAEEPTVVEEMVSEEIKAEETQPASQEVIPGWLKDTETEEMQAADAEESVGWIVSSEEESEAFADDEDVPDWLKEMRAEESASVEADSDEDKIEIASEGDYKPGWLDEISSKDQVEEAVADQDASSPELEIPDWLQDTAIATPPEPVEQAPAEPPRPDDATWIQEIGKEVPSYEFEDPREKTKTEEFSKEELPDWLQDFDSDEEPPAQPVKTEEPEDEYSWQPAGAESERSDTELGSDDVSEEKLDLNKASLIQMERLPGMGFSRAQIIFSHREENGPYADFDELLELPGITPDTLNSIRNYIEIKPEHQAAAEPESLAPERVEPTPTSDADAAADLAPVAVPEEILREPQPIIPIEEADDQHHAKQIEAQQKFAQGEVSEAMSSYDQLIKKGKRLDEVIADLEVAAKQQPKSADIQQALGDAYMRADRLQEALDSYSKAEKLLQ